jgi:hypothetical protein
MVFKELRKAPDFDKGLFQGGSIFDRATVMKLKYPMAQAGALVEFLQEIIDMLDYREDTHRGYFHLA